MKFFMFDKYTLLINSRNSELQIVGSLRTELGCLEVGKIFNWVSIHKDRY